MRLASALKTENESLGQQRLEALQRKLISSGEMEQMDKISICGSCRWALLEFLDASRKPSVWAGLS